MRPWLWKLKECHPTLRLDRFVVRSSKQEQVLSSRRQRYRVMTLNEAIDALAGVRAMAARYARCY
jgi:hypothetical protein